MCFWPGVCWGTGVVLCFDTCTLTITSRGFYAAFGHTPDSVRIFISYPLGAGGHSTLTVYVGLEQMFYDINGKVYMYELIDNLSMHFSVANNDIEPQGVVTQAMGLLTQYSAGQSHQPIISLPGTEESFPSHCQVLNRLWTTSHMHGEQSGKSRQSVSPEHLHPRGKIPIFCIFCWLMGDEYGAPGCPLCKARCR